LAALGAASMEAFCFLRAMIAGMLLHEHSTAREKKP